MPNTPRLPGMEDPALAQIEEAAERYREIRDERCALSRKEAEAKGILMEVMKKAGRTHYAFNGWIVTTTVQENVKVKTKDDEDDEEESTYMTANGRAPRLRKKEAVVETKPAESETNPEDSEKAVRVFFSEPIAAAELADTIAEINAGERPLIREQEADDFTAERCECGRIDGGHTEDCPKHTIPHEDYLAYVEANIKTRVPQSVAHKLALTRAKDGEVRAWLAEQAKPLEHPCRWPDGCTNGAGPHHQYCEKHREQSGEQEIIEVAEEAPKKSRKRAKQGDVAAD